MKKVSPLIILSVFLIALLFAFGQSTVKGPIVDEILVDVRMQEEIGLKDTAEGKTDLFYWGVQGNVFKALPENVREKLDVYKIPSGSWSLMVNPIPNKAPYTVKNKDGEFFNPFAITEIRYALNWLIDRKYIVDEILGGDGDVCYTPMTPGQPGVYKYNLIASKLGMTPKGDEKKAIAAIDAAMQKAAALPENKGRLVKGPKFWQFDGKDVSVKILIRVDDPKGRLLEGRYIADQIEKAGIKAERLELDRRKCIMTAYYSNPADYQWHMYTEGWGAGATRRWWDISLVQMYAPWYGYMAGGADPANWNYENKEIDDITQKTINGQFIDEKEYWDMNLRALELGLKDACRIWVCIQQQYYAANKERFLSRMAYGVGDGLNSWSVKTADVKPNKDGKKVFRFTEYSARGALFMSAWDPIGTEGFTDVYSRVLMEPMRDGGSFESPYSAEDTMWRVNWDLKKVLTKVSKNEKGELVGQIDVPENAVLYNSAEKKWKPVGKGVKAFSTGTYTFKFAKYHNGQAESLADILYAFAYSMEWATKDGDNDKYYDDAFASVVKPGLDIVKGWVINKDGTITTYFDFNWPMDKNRVAATGIPAWTPLTPWPIYEALAKLVAEGGAASKRVYSFTPSGEEVTEPDLLDETCASDIAAKIEEMKAAKYVPASIVGYKTAAAAIADYNLAIKWIKEKKHAFISDGPFWMQNYDAKNNSMVMKAFRDPTYPFTPYYWKNLFVAQRTRIDKVETPATPDKTKDTIINVNVSVIAYPADTATAATKGNVKATLILPSGEKVYAGTFVKNGVFQIVIPAKDTSALTPGAYLVVIETQLTTEAPAVETVFLVFF